MNFLIGCFFVWVIFDCARWVNKVTAKVDAAPPPIPAVRVIYQATSMEDSIQMDQDFHRIAKLEEKLDKCQADLERCQAELRGCRCGSFRGSTPSIQTLPRDVEDYEGAIITAEETERATRR